MKKVLTIILMALAITALFVSCDDPKHEHSYSTEWKYDETNHWHECSCGEKIDVAAHSFGEWEVVDSVQKRTCTVCKYEETREIPRPVSVWDGKIYTEADGLYEFKDATKSYGGFYKHTGDQNIWGDVETSSADASCKKAATDYVAYFDSLFVNTGKMQFEFNDEGSAIVTINSADAFAAIKFISGYMVAKAIKETTGGIAGGKYHGWIENVTVKIAIDIDLDNKEWKPFNFHYSIDFQDHIVSNLNCVRPTENGVGLFGGFTQGKFSNLILKNATVSGKEYVGAVVSSISNASIENVNVINATVKGAKYVGGITGYAYANIKNCSVEGSTIQGLENSDNPRQIGGIVGNQNSGDVTGCIVSGCKIYGSENVGGIAGRTNCQESRDINVKNNTVSGTEVTARPGIESEERASTFIGKSSNYVGWISGGEYLSANDGYTYGPATTGSGQAGKCDIRDNTVDGVKH